ERFSDKILNQIAKSYPYLKYLNLARYSDGLITDKGLYAITNSYHKLEYLNISHLKEFSEIVIWNVIYSCPKLQEFNIRECKISYTTIKKIELYLKIKYINSDIASRYLKRIGKSGDILSSLFTNSIISEECLGLSSISSTYLISGAIVDTDNETTKNSG
ncbi:30204_t:CDS:2, partial [Gigaspora margarita]